MAGKGASRGDGARVETLRKWMQDDGLWLSRKQRRAIHRPRSRRECFGELIQIDGSNHRWFEERGPPCTLLVFIHCPAGYCVAMSREGMMPQAC